MVKYHQGAFNPKNPEKYKGDFSKIYWRSSWELKLMMEFDRNPNVIKWSSEEIVIPYRCKTDGRLHRYFIDFWIKRKLPDGSIQEFLIEVKPFIQTQPPKKPTKLTKRYIQEVETYAKNTSKWEAAETYAKNRNMIFEKITEKDLFNGR
jgi:hypothetical protein